jgi:integrase/recombinase XerD
MQIAGCTEATQVNYARAVRDMMHFTGKTPDQLTEQEIIAHLCEYRDQKKLSSSSLNTRICAIKYLYREVYRRLDIAVDLPNPRRSKQIGKIMTAAEVKRLLETARTIRHAAILNLLYDLGLRANELAHLRVSDFDKASRSLIIRFGKGGRHRTLPYGETLRDVLNEYFRQRRPKDWLFRGVKGHEHTSVRGVQWVVKETVKRAGLSRDIHPHTLRHTFAVHYLNNGGNLVRLQQLLGHAHLTTTLLYLRYANIPLVDIPTPLDILRGRNGKN